MPLGVEAGAFMPLRDPRIWMWSEACELLERAERLHRQFFQLALSAPGPAWEPPVDVFETERELWLVMALPGVAPGNLRIEVRDRELVIAGMRALPVQLRRARIYRLEIPYGRFERRIELPPGRFEFGTQELTNGCLMLSLRKLREGE